jgi:hypothetical protein
MKTLPQFDPYRRLFWASYTITEEEARKVFLENPKVEVLILPNNQLIERPEE